MMEEKNICMTCGRKSKNRFEYRVFGVKGDFRDFCKTSCLIEYYKRVKKQENETK